MPRPSLKAQRSEEILDAYERCILRDGNAGAALEQIAEESQMKRSILRHYIGNRDDILVALGERWQKKYQQTWQQLLDYLPADSSRLVVLLDSLFMDELSDEAIVAAVVGGVLFSEAKRMQALKTQLQSWLDEFVAILTQELCRAYSSRSKAECEVVAHGILGIYLTAEALKPMALTSVYMPAMKQSAQQLMQGLA